MTSSTTGVCTTEERRLLQDAETKAWAWHLPFVVGAIPAVIARLLRRTLHETNTAETRTNKGRWRHAVTGMMVIAFLAALRRPRPGSYLHDDHWASP